MNLSRSIAASVIWGKVLRISELFSATIFSIAVVRKMSVEEYSSYASLNNLIAIGLFFSSLGIAETAARFMPAARARISERFARNLFLTISTRRLLVCAVIATAYLLLNQFFGDALTQQQTSYLTEPALVLTLLFLLRAVWETLDWHFTSTLLWWRGLISRSVGQILALVLVFPCLALIKSPVTAVLVAQALSTAASIGLYLVLARDLLLSPSPERATDIGSVNEEDRLIFEQEEEREIVERGGTTVTSGVAVRLPPLAASEPKVETERRKSFFREIYKYSLAIWLINIFTFGLANQVDILLITLILPGNPQLGAYSLAVYIVFTTHSIVGVWGRTFLPTLASIEAERGVNGMRKAIEVYYKLNLLMVLPTLAALGVMSSNLMATLYGKGYSAAGVIVATQCAFLIVLNSVGYSVPLTTLYVLRQQNKVLFSRMCFGAINIVMDIILMPQFGVVAAIFSTGLCTTMTVLVEYWLMCGQIKFKLPGRYLLKIYSVTALATGFAGVFLFLNLKPGLVPLLLQAAVFGLVFLGSSMAFKIIGPEDKAALINLLQRRPRLQRYLNRVLTVF